MLTPTAFAARALALVGLPYRLGAEWSPAVTAPGLPAALDCSELVEGLFRENGTPIGDLAAAQFDKTVAATGPVQVGDLVFLRNNPARWNRIGHVAVVVGGSQGVKALGGGAFAVAGEPVIVEARGRNTGVVRTSLTYWRTRAGFTGVRRLPSFALDATASQPPAAPGVPAALSEDGQVGPKSVRALQWSLTAVWGYPLTSTGALDKPTRTALRDWLGLTGSAWDATAIARLQSRVLDVPADGQAGPVTNRRWQRWLNTLIAAYGAQTGSGNFRVGAANLEGYAPPVPPGKTAAVVKTKMRASAIMLSETNRDTRRALEDAHGPTWWVFPHTSGRPASVALLLDLAKFTPDRPGSWAYYRPPGTRLGHGAVRVPATRRAVSRRIEFVAVHVRPQAIASPADKAQDVAKARALVTGPDALVGGDFALNSPAMPGYKPAAGGGDTMNHRPGPQPVDWVFAKGPAIVVRGSEVQNPGDVSDHLFVVGLVTAKP